MDILYPRCAGIDISKRDAKVCVRIQGSGSRPTTSTVTTWPSVTNSVLALKEHLLAEEVTGRQFSPVSRPWWWRR